MGSKKSGGSLSEGLRDLLNKEFKGSVVHLGSDALQADVTGWVKTGWTLLDTCLGGGLPLGRTFELYGANSCGKTTLALHMLANCQAAGGIGIYVDVEKTFSKDLAARLGVDLDNLLILDERVALEEVFAYVRKAVPAAREAFPDKPVLLVWDTLAATPTVGSLTGKGQVGAPYRARVIREELSTLTQILAETNVSLVFVNHTHEVIDRNAGWGGVRTTTSGGGGPKFYASARINLRVKGVIRDEEKRVIGQEVLAKLDKNKLGAPRGEVCSRLYFGLGFVDEWSVFDYLRERGAISQAGAWSSIPMPDGTVLKTYPGKYMEVLREHPDLSVHLAAMAAALYEKEIPDYRSIYDLGSSSGEEAD